MDAKLKSASLAVISGIAIGIVTTPVAATGEKSVWQSWNEISSSWFGGKMEVLCGESTYRVSRSIFGNVTLARMTEAGIWDDWTLDGHTEAAIQFSGEVKLSGKYFEESIKNSPVVGKLIERVKHNAEAVNELAAASQRFKVKSELPKAKAKLKECRATEQRRYDDYQKTQYHSSDPSWEQLYENKKAIFLFTKCLQESEEVMNLDSCYGCKSPATSDPKLEIESSSQEAVFAHPPLFGLKGSAQCSDRVGLIGWGGVNGLASGGVTDSEF